MVFIFQFVNVVATSFKQNGVKKNMSSNLYFGITHLPACQQYFARSTCGFSDFSIPRLTLPVVNWANKDAPTFGRPWREDIHIP